MLAREPAEGGEIVVDRPSFGARRGAVALRGALLLAALAFGAGLARAGDDPPPAPKPAPDAKPEPAPAPKAPDPSSNEACMACHGDAAKAGKAFVDPAAMAKVAHGKRDCTECHADDEKGWETFPHRKGAKTTACAECHDDAAAAQAKSRHGAKPEGTAAGTRMPVCVDCHGGAHEARKASDPASRLYPLNVSSTCGACHTTKAAPKAVGTSPAAQRDGYTDDVHGRAIGLAGLIVGPTCLTCHGDHNVVDDKDVVTAKDRKIPFARFGGHGIRDTKDPASPVNPANVSESCGKCHMGILAQYRESVHGRTARGTPDKNANHEEPATCSDCHKPHHTRAPLTTSDFKRQVMETCGKCHGERLGSYRNTYHGRVSDLGFEGVASCTDCHSAHSILPTADPKSTVHGPEPLTQTCAQCHPGATERFSTYAVHADPNDKVKWRVLYWARTIMTSLIVGVWCLAGLHILLWFLRAVREPRLDHSHLSGRWYQRWPPFYRILHITVASTFLLLALTGMPLRFHATGWGQALYSVLGGPASVRFLHRLGGVVTFGYFIAYLVHIGRRLARGEKGLFRGPHSMLPRWKDVQDVRANFGWFLRGGPRPNFDRWTYWEKFDFWAEVWGVGFIGVTGLIMWFPILSTSVLPGWAVNLAHILHSYEALLATGFIFSVHFFHANLRPGKFPMDPIIFTGRIPEEELKLERPAEYARMKADGRLEREALPPPDPALVRRAYRVGGTLLSIGLLLLALMLYGLVV